jgi:hypothetical protein
MVVAVVVLGGAIAYFVYQPHKQVIAPSVQSASVAQALPQIDYSTVAMTKSYSNDTYKFSLSMPDSFTARELPKDDSGATTILLESADHADGVQIIVTPFGEDLHALTADRIHQDVPDISDSQPVEISQNYSGLAFRSDNEAFGASREVWFAFRGNLYQISTYDRLDPLLKKIFATWKFTL